MGVPDRSKVEKGMSLVLNTLDLVSLDPEMRAAILINTLGLVMARSPLRGAVPVFQEALLMYVHAYENSNEVT